MDVTEAHQGELVDLAGSLRCGSVDAIIGVMFTKDLQRK